MKTKFYYKILSMKMFSRSIIDLSNGRKVKSSKVKQELIRGKKRDYRLSRPKKTRRIYDYEN